MDITTINAYDFSQDLLSLAGYTVSEDTDQPGLYVWTREEKGRLVAGCDSSLPSAEEAWNEVKFMVAEVLAEEANMSPAEWKALTAEERQAVIVEQFC